jgi:DNA mismatch repair protein MutH
MKSEYDSLNEKSILKFAKRLEGTTLRGILNKQQVKEFNDKYYLNREKQNKGRFGQKVEEFYFSIKNNSRSEPDFTDTEIELKITPLKELKNGNLVPKERLVCNIINFNEIVSEKFETSSFMEKNKRTLIIRYIDPMDKKVHELDYQFHSVEFLELKKSKYYSEFKKDWNKIVEKIKKGKAHELSESDTCYLGACTKGANNTSLRSQPFSEEPAMQRAFSFKSQFMKKLLNKD